MEPLLDQAKPGVLVISHGSSKPDWIQQVDEAVEAVRQSLSIPVVSAFLEMVEGRLVQDGIDELEAEDVSEMIVVPLFISSGSTHIDEIRWALGVQDEPRIQTDMARFKRKARVTFGTPIDDHPIIGTILYENVRTLSIEGTRETLLVVGHGSDVPGFHERWREGLVHLAERICKMGGFAGAETAMLLPDELGEKIERLKQAHPDCTPIVVPLFLSEGYFTGTVIPRRLAGYDYRYNGKALLPSPLISEWILEQVHYLLSSAEPKGD